MSQYQSAKDVSNTKWGIWLPVAVIVAAFLAYFYAPASSSAYVSMAILVGGFVIAALLFFVSPSGKQFIAFSRDAYREARKVVWPTRVDVLKLTGVVVVFVIIMALFIWGVDKTLEWFLYDLILGRV